MQDHLHYGLVIGWQRAANYAELCHYQQVACPHCCGSSLQLALFRVEPKSGKRLNLIAWQSRRQVLKYSLRHCLLQQEAGPAMLSC